MSEELIALLVVLGLVLLVVWLVRRARRVNRQQRAARDTARRMAQPKDPFRRDYVGGDPRTLKLGDLVEWPGARRSYSVRGTVTFTEDGYTWREHFIDPISGAKRYLSVSDEDGDLEVVVWTEVDNFDIRLGQRQVAYDGVVYDLKEKGDAAYTTTGTTDLPASGRVRYGDYHGPLGKRLSFERFNGGKLELSVGQVITDGQLIIYPAS